MEIYRFAFIILLSSLLVSCGEKKQETGNADKAAEKKTPAFTLPEVPVMLQSVEDRLHFVVNHYWDKFDFKDTAYIHAPDITEQAMANYIDLLTRVPQVMADSCVTRTLEKVSLEPKMLNYFVETLRKYLFDPNSPMRNEEIFEPVCRFVASYASADEAAQSRARYDLKLIDMNRVAQTLGIVVDSALIIPKILSGNPPNLIGIDNKRITFDTKGTIFFCPFKIIEAQLRNSSIKIRLGHIRLYLYYLIEILHRQNIVLKIKCITSDIHHSIGINLRHR